MNKKEIDELIDDIVDVIYGHQDDLSDGFEFYVEPDTWKEIREEIKTILIKKIRK